MKHLLRFIFLLPIFCHGQITTPIIKAGFGVDADLRANYFNGFVQSGNDDWFADGTPGTGNFIIDTTGAAAIVSAYTTNPASRRWSWFRSMRFPAFSVQNNRLLLDALMVRDYHGDDSTVFASGSNKNGMSPENWTCPVSQGIPDKNDILDMFMHVRRAGPNSTDSLWFFGGLSLDNTTGNRYCDFEMYQTDIYYDRVSRKWYGYGPDAGHTTWEFDASGNVTKPGDIIFTAEYQSSSLTNIEARIWIHNSSLSITPTAFSWGGLFDGASSGATYGYASIMPKTAGAYYTGLQCGNNTWGGPFAIVLQDESVVTNYSARQFVEFSVNLTKLGLDPVAVFGGDVCGTPFNRMVVKTRASASFTAELKDFVAPTDLFLAPRVLADADVPIFCSDTAVSTLTVTNPHGTSVYTWTTPDGHIVGSNTGTSITVDSPGTYIVTQQLIAGCAPYATDTVTITRVSDCTVLAGYIKNFDGIYDERVKLNQLSWTVLSNENISTFTIEKNRNNGKGFFTIWEGTPDINAIGEKSYSIYDNEKNISNQPVYYRLKMYNKDQSYKYSKVAAVYPKLPYTDNVIITPNPVRDYVQINIYSSVNTLGEIAIINSAGKTIKMMKQPLNRGSNIISMYEASTWHKGSYYILVKIGDKLFDRKIVVID